jgi:hypothetical protein
MAESDVWEGRGGGKVRTTQAHPEFGWAWLSSKENDFYRRDAGPTTLESNLPDGLEPRRIA